MTGYRDSTIVTSDGRLTVEEVETIDVPSVSAAGVLSVGTGDAPERSRTWVEADGTLTVIEGEGGGGALPTPIAAWVTDGSDNTPTLSVEVPVGVLVAGDSYVWHFDTSPDFDSGDFFEVSGTVSSDEANSGDVLGTLLSALADDTWYAKFRAPGKTEWSNTVSQTIVAAPPPPATFTYVASNTFLHSGSQYSRTGASIGTAYSSRRVLVLAVGINPNRLLLSATIGGVTAKIHTNGSLGASSPNALRAYAFSAVVPTGSTADIVMNMSGSLFNGISFIVLTVDDDLLVTSDPTIVVDSAATSATSLTSSTLAIEPDGCIAGLCVWANSIGKSPYSVTSSYYTPTVDAAGGALVAFHINGADGTDATFTTSWAGSYEAHQIVTGWL